ncbi:hypothetical protein BCR36DRAFT_373586 [Piromyces finnis]|uniref:Uncharacterized protein n=1 Tax=Piromyces finnis TaxID=1754191 RepID=A0A1Y1UZK5_9FUNG|nr:hypothetical protein BCR36DRAFT_373586 [Piromyces finnis]|eukprot:ORX43935.1 hypothetical protein BCR36DRAFT_373586 [Piromyces finnis]
MLYLITYILAYIPLIYSLNVAINNVPDNFVLKYKEAIWGEDFNHEYYCRENNCIEIKYNEELNTFIEFPDENNNLKYYITDFFIYDDNLKKFLSFYDGYYSYDNSTYISVKCNNDSDCLYNKCIENHCAYNIYNDVSPVTNCTTIYKVFALFDYSYVHCGRPHNAPCTKDNECASKSCSTYDRYRNLGVNTCNYVSTNNFPSDSTHIKKIVQTCICIIILICLCILMCIIRCCYKIYLKYKDYDFNKI